MQEEQLVKYIFTVEIIGHGATAEEAWLDAVEALSNDPGEPTAHVVADCPEGHDMPSGRLEA